MPELEPGGEDPRTEETPPPNWLRSRNLPLDEVPDGTDEHGKTCSATCFGKGRVTMAFRGRNRTTIFGGGGPSAIWISRPGGEVKRWRVFVRA